MTISYSASTVTCPTDCMLVSGKRGTSYVEQTIDQKDTEKILHMLQGAVINNIGLNMSF